MVGRKRLDKSLYVCYVCGSERTQITKSGIARWILNLPTKFVICRSCYAKYIVDPAKKKMWDRTPAARLYNRSRFRFKTKQIHVPNDPKTGVCNLCRAVAPFDCQKTNLHHEHYDESDMLKHTIELCPRCHSRITASNPRRKVSSHYSRN